MNITLKLKNRPYSRQHHIVDIEECQRITIIVKNLGTLTRTCLEVRLCVHFLAVGQKIFSLGCLKVAVCCCGVDKFDVAVCTKMV